MKTIEDVVITINGVTLNRAQVMTLCAAVDCFGNVIDEMSPIEGSVDDALCEGYHKNLDELKDIITGWNDADETAK